MRWVHLNEDSQAAPHAKFLLNKKLPYHCNIRHLAASNRCWQAEAKINFPNSKELF